MATEFNQARRHYISNAHLGWAVLVVVSIAFAVASLFVPPIFFIGLAGVLVGVVVLFRYPYVGLLLYLLTYIIRPGELYPALQPLALERIIGLGVLIAGVLMYKKKHGTLRLPNERPFRLLLLFFAVIIASLVVSLDAESTITSVESFAKLIIFYLLIYYTIDTRLKFDIFVGLFVLLILREAAMSFTDYYGGGAIYRMGIQRAVGRTSFGSGANSLAATLAIAMPFMIAYWKIFQHWVLRIGVAGGLFLLVLMTINTGSRGGLLAMLTVCACTIYYTRYRMVTLIVAVVLMTGGWFMLPDQYKTRYATLVSDEDANDISTGRVEIWENGIRMFVAHPILGVGMNAFLLANSSGEYGPPIELNPHSLIIQLIANVGLIGTVVWFAFLWSWFRLLFQSPLQRRGPPGEEKLFVWLNAYKQAILASTAAMFVSGLTAHNLGRFNWYMYAALTVLMLRLFAREIERLRSQSELEVDGSTDVPATAPKTLTT